MARTYRIHVRDEVIGIRWGTLGDMHHAAVAVQELEDDRTPRTARQVARKLRWTTKDGLQVDDDRAITALLAAEEHGLIARER